MGLLVEQRQIKTQQYFTYRQEIREKELNQRGTAAGNQITRRIGKVTLLGEQRARGCSDQRIPVKKGHITKLQFR